MEKIKKKNYIALIIIIAFMLLIFALDQLVKNEHDDQEYCNRDESGVILFALVGI